MEADRPMVDFASAMSALKTIKDTVQSMIGLRDAAAFQAKQLELQGIIIDAQNAVFEANQERTELLAKIAQLESQIERLEDWEEEKQRYKRVSVASHVVAYISNDADTPETADHWVCANCFEDQHKVHLQHVPISSGRALIIACPRCKSVNYLQGQAQPDHANILAKFAK
jgi:hypothetical protein